MSTRWVNIGAAFVLLLILAPIAHAMDSDALVEAMIRAEQPPEGVVFEVVGSDPNGLQWALPRIRGYVKRLRARFPGLEMAVVTHGSEEFSLQTKMSKRYAGVHDEVRSLVQDSDVPVHVCAAYAETRGVEPQDFPDYVQVAPYGPIQIQNYEALGYTRIRVQKP